jgi:hypothetical protein
MPPRMPRNHHYADDDTHFSEPKHRFAVVSSQDVETAYSKACVQKKVSNSSDSETDDCTPSPSTAAMAEDLMRQPMWSSRRSGRRGGRNGKAEEFRTDFRSVSAQSGRSLLRLIYSQQLHINALHARAQAAARVCSDSMKLHIRCICCVAFTYAF